MEAVVSEIILAVMDRVQKCPYPFLPDLRALERRRALGMLPASALSGRLLTTENCQQVKETDSLCQTEGG